MSSSVTIGTVEFISVKDAASRSSYTRDYITRLARDEKIVATQVKRQWFVDPISLQNFIESTKIEREIRAQLLREERRREQQVYAGHETSERAPEEATRLSARAYLTTVSVVLCGVLLGVALQTVVPSDVVSLQVEQVAQVATTQADSAGAVATQTSLPGADTVVPQRLEEVHEQDQAVGQRRFTGDEGVLLLPVGVASAADTTVDELFSDEVTLTYRSAREGVVTPQLQDGAGTPMAFVMVPVMQASTSEVALISDL